MVRAFVDAWNAKAFDRFDDLMADDARLTVGGATIDCSGPATRSIAEHWIGGFSPTTASTCSISSPKTTWLLH